MQGGRRRRRRARAGCAGGRAGTGGMVLHPICEGFFGLVPLQFLSFGEVPLLFTYSEFYHYNSSSI